MKEKPNKKKYIIWIALLVVVIAAIIFLVISCQYRKLTVTMTVDNKTYYEIEDIKKGDVIIEPDDPEKEGYTFDGWYLNGKEFDFSTPIKKNLKLEAKWTINKYTITIKNGDGNITTEKVEYGKTLAEPKTPTRDGYTFDGWYVNGAKYDFNSKVKGDFELEARWIANNANYRVEHYQMNLKGEYDSTPTLVETFSGLKNATVTPSVKQYAGFKSPEAKTVIISANNDTVVKYYYERNKYSLEVVGDDNVASVTGSGVYYFGEKVEVSATFNEGYEIDSWSNGIKEETFTYTMDSKNTTLNATSKLIDYNINYEISYLYDGEEIVEELETTNPSTYTMVDDIELVIPEFAGYTFDHWLVNGEELEGNTIAKGLMEELTITAVVTPNNDTPYVVEHYLMNEFGEYEEVYQKDEYTGTTGTRVTPSPLTSEDIEDIDKYYKVPEVQEEVVLRDGNLVIIYEYERLSYSLTVENDEGITSNISILYKDEYIPYKDYQDMFGDKIYFGTTIKLNALEEEGYEFVKWTATDVTIENEDNAEITFEMAASDVTINNTSSRKQYKVTFEVEEDATFTGDKEINVTFKDLIPEPVDPTKEGFELDFWSLDKVTPYNFETPMVAHDVTLYPVWKLKEYTITYKLSDGEVCEDCKDTVYNRESAFSLPVAVKKGNVFDGWIVNGNKENVITVINQGTTADMELTPRWIQIIDVNYFDKILSNGFTAISTKTDDINAFVGVINENEPFNIEVVVNTLKENIKPLFEENKINSITVTYSDIPYTINAENYGEKLTEIVTAIGGATYKDLEGNTITVSVLLNPKELTTKELTNKLDYTVTFEKGTIVTVQEFKQAEASAMGSINGPSSNHEFQLSVENGNEIVLKYASPDLDTFIALWGAGIKTAVRNFIQNKNIDHMTIFFDGMDPVPVYKKNVGKNDSEDYIFMAFASSLLDAFQKAIGIDDALDIVNSDLPNLSATIKIYASSGNYFDDEIIEEYIIRFEPLNPSN